MAIRGVRAGTFGRRRRDVGPLRIAESGARLHAAEERSASDRPARQRRRRAISRRSSPRPTRCTTQQKWDEAIAAYKAIVAKTPALSVVNLQIAASYRNKKDYDNAVAAYEALLATDPANEKARVGIAAVSMERGDAAKAEATLIAAAETESAGRDVYFSLAEIKSSKGEADEAARLYRKAADADPSWGKPRYKIGLLAMKTGDSAAADPAHDAKSLPSIPPPPRLRWPARRSSS